MQYLEDKKSPWLTIDEFVPHVMSYDNYKKAKQRGNIKVSARACFGKSIFVEFDSLPTRPTDYKQKVVDKYGDPRIYIAMQPLKNLVTMDMAARQFYAVHPLSNGEDIPFEYQMKYARQCDWLNVISRVMEDKRTLKDELHISIEQFWENIILLIKNDEEGSGLPTSYNRLRRRWKLYKDAGYKGLVEDWRFGNSHARKVTPKIENMILSLYAQPHKPYMNEVCMMFRAFMEGKLQVVDIITGEVFDPRDFYITQTIKGNKDVKLSKPYMLGESTVDYYVKKPGNEAIVNKQRMKAQEYDSKYRPSVKRIGALYAFSKLSMDDVDLPFQGPDGSRVVKSYQAYDCASQAIVGVSFSDDKNKELIMECMRDMFRLIQRNGWAIPFQIEMERHLTSAMKGKADKETGDWMDDIFTPGAVFPATTICQRAQSKRAEGFIKKKKYGFQKKRPGFQGRFYAKLLTNRLNEDQKPLRQAYEQIVENELADIAEYNNELHPKQDIYPGMTRWQVLEQMQHPELVKFETHQVVKFIGYSTATSIRAGVARVQYGDYMLPDITLITKTSYNGEIVAYYLPDDNGIVNSVFLFEDGKYLCEAKQKVGFHEAIIEQTADDADIMQLQWGQQKAFDAMVKNKGLQYVDRQGQVIGSILNVGTVAADKVIANNQKGIVKQLPAPEPEYMPMSNKGMSAADRALNDI